MSDLDRILDRISRPFEQDDEETIAETPSWLEAASVPIEGGQVRPMQPRGTQPERLEARELVRSRIEQQVGGPLREEGGGIASIPQRFRLQGGGRRSEDDIMRSIQQYIPGAEVQSVRLDDGSDRILFRRPDREDFEFINPAGFDRGDLGAAASYLFNFENLLATGASILTRTNAFPIRAALVGIGAGAGRGADIGLDVALGDRPPPIEDVLGDLALSTVFGIAGEGAGSVLSRGVNVIKGEGVLRLEPGRLQAIQAQRDLELPALTLGQQHPLIARREGQVAVTGDVLLPYYDRQLGGARESVVAYRQGLTGESASPVMTDAELENLVYRHTLALRENIDTPITEIRAGRRGLQQGRQEFEASSAAWVDRKYTTALEAVDGNVTFDLSRMSDTISDLVVGVQVPTRHAAELGLDETMRANRRIGGDLRDIINRLSNMPDELSGANGYEAIKSIRSELNAIRSGEWSSADAFRRQDMADAQQLHAAITEVLENARGPGRVTLERPTGEGQAFDEVTQLQQSDFTRLWRAANTSNAWRERVMRMDRMQGLAKDTNPVVLMDLYARPGEYESLRTLKRVMPEQHWKAFVDSFETRLHNRPNQINNIFDDFAIDTATLDLLVPRDRQLAFRALGRGVERLESASGTWARQTEAGERLLNMVNAGDVGQAVDLMNMAGGPESPTGRLFRAGVIENILSSNSKRSPLTGEMVLLPEPTSRMIGEILENRSLNNILTEGDRIRLGQYQAYLDSVATTADAGASIYGAEVASQVSDVLNPSRAVKGLKKQLQAAFTARILINPQASALLFGRGTQTPPRPSLRTTATILSLIARDVVTEEGERTANLFLEEAERQ